MALSGLTGWAAGYLCSMPAQIATGLRNSDGCKHIFVVNTALGLLVWAVWTFVLGAASWLVIAVPCALLLGSKFILRFQLLVKAATLLLVIGFVALKVYPYRDGAASELLLQFAIGLPYGSFAIIFAVVTAWSYVRGVARYESGRASA